MMSKEEHKAAMMGLCIAHITSPAENRMRARRAVEQLEQTREESAKTAANADSETVTADTGN